MAYLSPKHTQSVDNLLCELFWVDQLCFPSRPPAASGSDRTSTKHPAVGEGARSLIGSVYRFTGSEENMLIYAFPRLGIQVPSQKVIGDTVM